VLALEGLNVYDVLNYRELVMTSSTAKAIEARFGQERQAAARSAGESNE
jgi:ribosomal protein L4